MPHTVKVTRYDDNGRALEEVEVERLSPAEIQQRTREELSRWARTKSEGGSRPDNMPREDWRVSQGAYYDDDRC